MHGKVDLAEFFCRNPRCPEYGRLGGKLRLVKFTGRRRVAFLECAACRVGFSETKGTPFENLRISDTQLLLLWQVANLEGRRIYQMRSSGGTARPAPPPKGTLVAFMADGKYNALYYDPVGILRQPRMGMRKLADLANLTENTTRRIVKLMAANPAPFDAYVEKYLRIKGKALERLKRLKEQAARRQENN